MAGSSDLNILKRLLIAAVKMPLFCRTNTQEKAMMVSEKGLALIKDFEGCKLEAYQDSVGVWTIGYGHTKTAQEGMAITQEQAEELLARDVHEHALGVYKALKVSIEQHRFDALASLAFNVGVNAVRNSTLLEMINRGDAKLAAAQFDRWNKAGGKVLAGLTRRRAAERKLYEG